MRQPFAEDKLCELGRFGQKTGAGWYKYDENRNQSVDPAVVKLIAEWTTESAGAAALDWSGRNVDRCIYALVNEARGILEEGFALRAVDIDIIYLNGYGFPAYRGGPMWYADTVGLKKVLARVEELRSSTENCGRPASLLSGWRREGQTFAEWSAAGGSGEIIWRR